VKVSFRDGVFLTCFILTLGITGSRDARAGDVHFFSGLGAFSVPVVSFAEARFQTVVRQHFDYSCGSAAVATMLTFHYDNPVSEEDVFTEMWENGDQEKIQSEGFSLLDIKNYLEAHGYQADGFRTSLDRIEEVNIPAIVTINTNGYRHFVVVKGIVDDEIVVGDPALGVKIYQREEFEAILDNDVIFLIHSDREIANENFNDEQDWGVRTKAPFGTALSNEGLGLSTFSILLPANNQF